MSSEHTTHEEGQDAINWIIIASRMSNAPKREENRKKEHAYLQIGTDIFIMQSAMKYVKR